MDNTPQTETANERFERMADAFYNETGYMAPGKSVPMAWSMGEQYEQERKEAWNEWTRHNGFWGASNAR